MADKLSESSWTSFTKGVLKKQPKLKLEDAALVKALGALDRSDDSKPEEKLKALEAVIEQIKKQVVANARRKKEFGDELFDDAKDKLYELLEAAEAQQKATQKAAVKVQPAEDEEEESPALLTTKMIPLLREVRKGELVLQALVALAGKETVVLLSRRAISPARGKLLKEQMSSPSGLKFVRGECLWENNALTFVVQAPAAGLAKRIRAALLAQTELRLKVRVRGEDGVEEEGDEDGAEAAQPDSVASGAASAASPAGMVAFTKTRLAWDATRKKVQAELRRLEQAILSQCAAFPDAADIAEGTRNLYRILDHLDERLIDKLDEALNAQTAAERQRLHAQAREIVDEYIDYVKGEELFADIDDNGFVPVAITSTLNAALGAMARQLRAVTV